MPITHLPRPAALALSLGLLFATASNGSAAPAAIIRADDLPDLSVALSGAPNPALAGGSLTYTLTVKNTTIQIWDPELRRYYTGGADASGVVVRDTLPAGAQFVSASADSGFSCAQGGGVVTCSGGAIPMGGNGHITINATAPNAVGSITNTATVDPNNTIAERNESNNTTAVTTNVRVDLVASATVVNDRITFTVTNVSGAPASNVWLNITEPSLIIADVLSLNGDWTGFCNLLSGGPSSWGYEEGCIIDTIPAHSSAGLTLRTFSGDHTYTLVVDKNNTIAETNESNNTVSATAFGYY
jgi:hypothetical protein